MLMKREFMNIFIEIVINIAFFGHGISLKKHIWHRGGLNLRRWYQLIVLLTTTPYCSPIKKAQLFLNYLLKMK